MPWIPFHVRALDDAANKNVPTHIRRLVTLHATDIAHTGEHDG